MPLIWLIGMMGAGKTEVGRHVAEALGVPLIDTDLEIEARLGASIAAFWREHGEDAFRDLESAEIERIAAGTTQAVVATGGGVVLRSDNVKAMRDSGTVIWLTARPAALAGRVGDGQARPLLAGAAHEDRLGDILEKRADAYRRASHRRVDTTNKTPQEVTAEVLQQWNAS